MKLENILAEVLIHLKKRLDFKLPKLIITMGQQALMQATIYGKNRPIIF
jgi:hypothetical protein